MNLLNCKRFASTAALFVLGCAGNDVPESAEFQVTSTPSPPGLRVSSTQSPLTKIPCGSVADCKDKLVAPVCGDTLTTACSKNIYNSEGTLGACVYRLAISPNSCSCVEGAVQYCADSNGGAGGGSRIQDCIAIGAQATSWGGCHN